MARLLIVYATLEGQTEKIARRLGELAAARGHAVRVADFHALHGEGWGASIDALILGASVHMEKHPAELQRWVRDNHAQLEALPSAFFSVSLSAAGPRPRTIARAQQYLETFLNKTGWRPLSRASLAGALQYSKYGLLKRWMMQAIVRMAGNRDLDPHRDYEYTDWAAVERFLDEFLTRAALG